MNHTDALSARMKHTITPRNAAKPALHDSNPAHPAPSPAPRLTVFMVVDQLQSLLESLDVSILDARVQLRRKIRASIGSASPARHCHQEQQRHQPYFPHSYVSWSNPIRDFQFGKIHFSGYEALHFIRSCRGFSLLRAGCEASSRPAAASAGLLRVTFGSTACSSLRAQCRARRPSSRISYRREKSRIPSRGCPGCRPSLPKFPRYAEKEALHATTC